MGQFLEVRNVYKYFGKLLALNNISFSIEKGEIVGLIGPNGAGKTTLFNIISGFYRASSGKIIFKEKDISKADPNQLVEMGMVRTFQIPRPFKDLTIYDNVAVGTLFSPNRRNKMGLTTEEFIENILKNANLYSLKDELAKILGHGNLKLLELGRAQAPCPELLLLDEPFAGLNSLEIQSIRHILQYLAEQGLTLIIVEHKLKELMKLVKRVIVLHYGEKIADGMPEEIIKNEIVLKAYLGNRWRFSIA